MRFLLEQSRIVFEVHPRVSAWFSTRRGGVSEPPFDTMNLSYGVGDDSRQVTENRRRMVALGGRRLDHLVMPHQVHHNHIEWIGPEWAGRGARGGGGVAATDGFLTTSPAVLLGMGFADCVPIFLTDEAGSFAGLLHAGWRGTVAQIQRRAIEQLKSRGIQPDRVLAGIGPAIGPCCYEVDAPVQSQVVSVVGHDVLTVQDPEHWRLDLKLANLLLLEEAGVQSDHIVVSDLCTGCRPDLFFSYRLQGGRSGRMGGYICLNPV